MSVRFQPLGPVPQETARVVRKSFRKGHPLIAFADSFGNFLECYDLNELYSELGQSAVHPAILTLITLLQFANGLSDRQAMEQVAGNLLWKYVLRLPLDHEGWDPSVLSEFRSRLEACNAGQLILDKLIDAANEKGLLKKSKQRTDSTCVLSAAKRLNRLELVHETMSACLEELSEEKPKFVLQLCRSYSGWRERYGESRAFNFKLANTDKARDELALAIANDGFDLLSEISTSEYSDELTELDSVRTLFVVWEQQFIVDESDGPRFRQGKEMTQAKECIGSPHDVDARYSRKGDESWFGYKTHFTETFDRGAPHLITSVYSTPGTTNDSEVLDTIHDSLMSRDLKPDFHLVDSGYAQAQVLKNSLKKNGIDVLCPLTNANSWQLRAGKGFDLANFSVNWKKKSVTCPNSVETSNWRKGTGDVINVSFPSKECQRCPFKEDCTTSESRKLQIKSRSVFEYMQYQRKRQNEETFRDQYKNRAGIEGTISQVIRRTDLRQSPYFGLAKTHLANILAATSVNVLRLANWLMNETIAGTRDGRFHNIAICVA